ncbi:MAG: hypothetical protein R2697_08890 [Ilumatobacteraceae bacterium]
MAGRFSVIGRTWAAHWVSVGSADPGGRVAKCAVGVDGVVVVVVVFGVVVVVVATILAHAVPGFDLCGTSRRTTLPLLDCRVLQFGAGVQSESARSFGVTVPYRRLPVLSYSSQQPVSSAAPKVTEAVTASGTATHKVRMAAMSFFMRSSMNSSARDCRRGHHRFRVGRA